MFADAYEKVSGFTHPVIISTRHFDGTIQCGCGAFVVVNNEGWILTAEHIIRSFFLFQQHAQEMSQYKEQIKGIEQNPSLNSKQKRREINKLKPNSKWITNHSFWWGRDGLALQGNILGFPDGDLVIARLSPYDPTMTKIYPVFKDPRSLRQGTSLCKLGFPFHEITGTFDEVTNTFQLAAGTLPLPRFPIEGIYTRNLEIKKTPDSKTVAKYLETSSPGLRGQSGGPIFDKNGTVWGIQSHTRHFPLGFSPKVKKNGKEIEENQFLNVGLGAHPESIVSFLSTNNITFTLSDY
jgi:hypothetical protein